MNAMPMPTNHFKRALAAAMPADTARRTSAVVRPDRNDTVLIKR